MNTLNGQVALVTGSSPGRGSAIAAAFADPAGGPHPGHRARPRAARGRYAQDHPNRQPVKED